MKVTSFLAFIFLTFLLIGCGNKVGVSGKVTFSDDHSPLTVGTVCFSTGDFLARGEIQPDGTFKVGSISNSDGLPSGTYQVYIIGADEETGKDKSGMPMMKSLIDPNTINDSKSPINIEVSSKTKRIELTVNRPSSK
ncbi:MAG: hypothetical protein LBJ67_04065 [Planctomycetaceae bacterium]|jgi:hypothetical protein|nr:hypothetical protein [Planctomycetaceae bacterium]